MRTTSMRWAALVAAGGLALTGCGFVGGSGDSADEPRTVDVQQTDPEVAPTRAPGTAGSGDAARSDESSSAAEDDSGSGSTDVADTVVGDARVARTSSLSITVEDLEQSAAKVRSAARKAGGYVSAEDSRVATDEGGRSWAEITLTVPVDELDSTTNDLAEIGEVTRRTGSAEDLTTQYTDTTARVKTKTKSVERLRKLIASTEDLDQIVTLEDELAQREADLESMTSQQKSLEARTDTAPITVSLSTETVTDEPPEEETGFMAGLGEGWSAFTSALAVGLTALGAVTPFAIALGVVLLPFGWWVRRRLSAR